MQLRSKPLILTALVALFCSLPAFSQDARGFVTGTIKGPDGAIIKGAEVTFENTEIQSKVTVKTDKKGHFVTSLQYVPYDVTISVANVVRAKRPHYKPGIGADNTLDFTLSPAQAAPPPAMAKGSAPAAGAAAGAVPAPAAKGKGDGKGDKEDEAAAKARAAELAKRKELNDSFAAGKAAIDAKQWDEAITQLAKASELDPKQQAVWAGLAEAYENKAKGQRGADADATYKKAFDAYDKLIELKPDEAGTYNNYALALAADKKMDDAKTRLAKAVELDPAGAGKYHYNLGALLMNTSQTDDAIAEFKKSIDADPTYAEAYFYYGTTLAGKSTADAKGNMVPPPGTIEALQKYVQLKPTGANAESAKQMIAALGTSVQTNYKDPNAPKAAPKAPAKKGK